MKLVEASTKPDEEQNTPSRPLATWLELDLIMASLQLYHAHAALQVKNVSPITPSNRSLKYTGNLKLDYSPFLPTGYTSCCCVPNVLIALLREGAYSNVNLCAAVERKERGVRGWSGVELTTQSPHCRSDERVHVNTRLSPRKHAFASPHHRPRRSRGEGR
jgi:hypothetical protein